MCHPLKGQGQRINTSLSGFILLRSNICTTPFITSTRLSMHPVFRSAGCRAGLHQSSIGIKAKAGVLAFAPGSGRAPENHRYQTGVHGSIHQSACCVSSARLISAHGLGIPAVADWGTAGARGPITSLGSRQHIYRAHGPAGANRRSLAVTPSAGAADEGVSVFRRASGYEATQ